MVEYFVKVWYNCAVMTMKVKEKTVESDSENNASKAVTRMMLKTLWSTTVRIFVPVTTLFIVGLIIDLNVGTKPYGMAVGTGAGAIIAVVLVVMQLKDIRAHAWQPVQPTQPNLAETQPTEEDK